MSFKGRKSVEYTCPKCGQVFIYSGTEFRFAQEDECCHECVDYEYDSEDDES